MLRHHCAQKVIQGRKEVDISHRNFLSSIFKSLNCDVNRLCDLTDSKACEHICNYMITNLYKLSFSKQPRSQTYELRLRILYTFVIRDWYTVS